MARMSGTGKGAPAGIAKQEIRASHFKRTWAAKFALAGLVATMLMAGLYAGTAMGKTGESLPPDFSVDTAQGKFSFFENRGSILVYFFSFPG